jgi:hypothetical protein
MHRNGERGAAIVEMAFIVPLLLMLVFGIVEFGIAFRDRLTIGNASQGAARVLTAMGQDLSADLAVLQSMEQTLSNLPSGGVGIVSHVDVFRANASGLPDSGCPGPACNRYQYTYVDGTGPLCDWSPCPDPSAGYAGWGWAPDVRNVAVDNLDVAGVRITFGHDWITGGLVPLPDVACDGGWPPTNCWFDDSVMRMEPQTFSVGGP